MRALVLPCLCVFGSSLVQAAPAVAPTEAGRRLQQGMRLYDVRRYKEAIDAFQQGYALDPDPQFLFALGQAYRMDGDCAAAVETFRAYLRTNPLPSRAEVTNRLIGLCASTAPKSPQTPAAETAPGATLQAPASQVIATAPRSSTARRFALTFAGVGLTAGAFVAAAIVQGVEHANYQSLLQSCAPPVGAGCSEAQIGGVERQMNAAMGLWITGGVLGAATIVTAVLQARRR